ncbi:MAG: cell wall-active antibiotics response protein [Bacteroidota bacterium]|nr:cell wall-active antibiotics response protein [Bacteroidota bacterium]MDX5431882.1 cell wall-active antibiotics response protein [Bacteroidota bacterium]MDX5470596.1 cell wall-active antibiotics response protein [Bacteroidota bacterium]
MKNYNRGNHQQGGRFLGVILLLGGILWLLHRLQITYFPDWLFSGPTLVFAAGLYYTVKTRFRKAGPLFITLLAVVWFLKKNNFLSPTWEYLTFPIILIALGAYFILRPKSSGDKETDERCGIIEVDDSGDRLRLEALFCGSKKRILSKDFKGGKVEVVFGGTELNFSQADFDREITLDVSIVFGGLKLIVPSNWDIQMQMSTVAAGVEDKRAYGLQVVPDKTLVLKGDVIFGGVEIQNH